MANKKFSDFASGGQLLPSDTIVGLRTGVNTKFTNVSNVNSVFGRNGNVVAVANDYDVSEVTGAAPILSPSFTGTPMAPTQAPFDNSTKLSTTAYVDTAISTGTVTSIFGRIGTVVAVTGDYSVSQVTGAAPLASPSFTGTPTAPTQLAGDNSTKLATTAYVDTGLATKEPTITTLSILKGGTGQSTANTAFNALAPSQTGQSGKVLTTNGTTTSWSTPPVTGTVTTVSVNTDNGFNGSVSNPTTTPAISIGTTITGILKGNGSSVSAAVATDIPITNSLVSSVNTMTSTVNGTPSNNPIINTNNLELVTTELTSTVNGQPSPSVSVCPSPQSISSSITFTNLDEKILLLAPSINANGIYIMQLKGGGSELNLVLSVTANSATFYNYSAINIISVSDSSGVINSTNISDYILFRGYLRTTTPDSYFVVTFSMPGQLLYSNPQTMTVWQYSESYLNEMFTFTNMITTEISNLTSIRSADLIFKMKINVIPLSISNPQSYGYCAASASNLIFQYSINLLTGTLSALSPASISLSGVYKLFATHLKNYLYATAGSTIFMYRISSTNGTLSGLSPSSIAGPSVSTGISIDPSDRFLYVCGYGTGQFGQFSITKATGKLVAIPSPPTAAGGMQDLAIHPSGKFLYAINGVNNSVYQYFINQSSGALTALATLIISSGTGPIKIQIHPSGLFAYVLNNVASTITVYTINTSTGQLSFASTFTPASIGNMQGLCISNNGLFIYYTSQTSNLVTQSTLNLSTGAIIAPTTSQAVSGARECSFDYSGNNLYVINETANRINAFTINQTTGAMTANSFAAAGTNNNGLFITN